MLLAHVQARDTAVAREGRQPARRSHAGLASTQFRNVTVSLGGPCPGTQVGCTGPLQLISDVSIDRPQPVWAAG